MISLRSLTSALLATAALVLAGCGGDDGTTPPAPVQVDSARTTRATLGPAGGTVVATAADGRRYTLTVEPGALATATEITATPVLSMGSAPLAAGLKGAVRFGPAGLRFALPATLRIEGANPATSTGSHLVGFLRSADGASMQLVPPTVAAADTIDMEVRHFSDVGVSQATAEQLAQVPIDAAASPADALVDEATRALATVSTDALRAAALIRLHDTRVAPRLTQAEFQALSTPAERALAVSMARSWLTLLKLNFDVNLADADLPGGLGPVVTALRLRVLALLTQEFEAGRSACMAPAPVGIAQLEGLLSAIQAEQQVASFRFVGGLPGLDADTVARRLNDCARIVFVPRQLPAFATGRPVSLDARAQLIFAADPNATILAPYAFKVSSNDATVANPAGLADVDGNYTTVVTPQAAGPVFEVEACVVPSINGVASVFCGKQTLAGAPAGVALSGEVRFFSGGPTSPSRPLVGSLQLRLRAELDGRFTVLEALGNVRVESTGTTRCFPFPADGTIGGRDVTTSFLRTSSITGGSQNDFLNAGKFIGFQLTGSTVIINDKILPDCSVVTETQTFTNAGGVQILSIERDAQNQPLVIVIGDSTGSHEGRLVRE